MKIYIVGAVSGVENWKDKFLLTGRYYRQLGHEVRTPLDYPEGLTQKEYMRLSCVNVLWSEKVVVTRNYEKSRGTRAEIALAESYGSLVSYE